MPLCLAIGTLILSVGLLWDIVPAIIVGIIIDIAVLIAWTWPSPTYEEEEVLA